MGVSVAKRHHHRGDIVPRALMSTILVLTLMDWRDFQMVNPLKCPEHFRQNALYRPLPEYLLQSLDFVAS